MSQRPKATEQHCHIDTPFAQYAKVTLLEISPCQCPILLVKRSGVAYSCSYALLMAVISPCRRGRRAYAYEQPRKVYLRPKDDKIRVTLCTLYCLSRGKLSLIIYVALSSTSWRQHWCQSPDLDWLIPRLVKPLMMRCNRSTGQAFSR